MYRVEFESEHADLSGFSDVTLQDIRIAAATDRERTELRTLVESGWPTVKVSVPESVRLYWDVPSELKSHEGLFYKRRLCSYSHRFTLKRPAQIHAAHRGPDFTLRHLVILLSGLV